MATAKKRAATKAAQSDSSVSDSQAEKAFAEPEHTDQQQPADALTPAEALEVQRDRADEFAEQRDLEDKQRKELEEVRDRNRELREDAYNHGRTEVSAVIHGIKDPSDKGANADAQDGPALKVYTGDGRVNISADGDVVLDREAAINLRRQLDSAIQAVA